MQRHGLDLPTDVNLARQRPARFGDRTVPMMQSLSVVREPSADSVRTDARGARRRVAAAIVHILADVVVVADLASQRSHRQFPDFHDDFGADAAVWTAAVADTCRAVAWG